MDRSPNQGTKEQTEIIIIFFIRQHEQLFLCEVSAEIVQEIYSKDAAEILAKIFTLITRPDDEMYAHSAGNLF